MTGAGFDSSTTAQLGSLQAAVEVESATELRVVLPAIDAGDWVLRLEDGQGCESDGLPVVVYSDGTGLGGAFGWFDYIDFVGDYWSSEVQDYVAASVFFTEPSSQRLWDYYGTFDDCTREDEIDEEGLTLLELGLEDVRLEVDGGDSIELAYASETGDFEALELDPEAWVPQTSYRLQSAGGDDLPSLSVSDFFRTGEPFAVTSPELYGSDVSTVPSTFELAWEPGDADRVLVQLLVVDEDGKTVDYVSCQLYDDGEHTVRTSVWSSWSAGMVLYLSIAQAWTGSGVLPFNNADSHVVGSYTVYGACLTE